MNSPVRKRFGQNFLQDQRVIRRIAESINPATDEHIVEIGPGRGALTLALVEYDARLSVIEIDRGGQVTYHGPGQLVAYPLASSCTCSSS